ncbi:unnamed protein product, partial [Adineta steineri]
MFNPAESDIAATMMYMNGDVQ